VTPLVAQALQLRTDGVAAVTEPACDLTCAVPLGPELFEKCYVVRIPTHGDDYTTDLVARRVIADDAPTDVHLVVNAAVTSSDSSR
jgi:hypothetical protein